MPQFFRGSRWCFRGSHKRTARGLGGSSRRGMAAMAISSAAASAQAVLTGHTSGAGDKTSPTAHCLLRPLRIFEGLRAADRSNPNGLAAFFPVAAAKRGGHGGALCARAVVSSPATRGVDVQFETQVFKKERITLAGRDEVGTNETFVSCMYATAVSPKY